ncbi:uncharacterized protein B0H18DRAFT_957321 [Fomitopsis serialis]|uniref:uncharacterized protein n=1 Tax=Fomitopsis serialis TaxID=139415 RepID=UPI00200784E9|nr:uncharacterized protein B0H18DRAFT_957321 [Neoantrodia serialis]KAH9919807.1 hypothetical protein B0H18DRAFT_957321 [Neoantrodia serialis]
MSRTILSPCGLAFETWDDILALLSDDLPSTSACARTCHAFLPAARTHLFRVARIDSPARLQALEGLIGASSVLARSIRTLEVRVAPCSTSETEGGQGHCEKEGWPRLVPRLDRLMSVRLQGFALEVPPEVGRAELPSVTSVWMKDMRSVGDDLRSASVRSTAKQLVASAGDTLESLVLRLEDLGEGYPPDDVRRGLLPELSTNRRLRALHILAVGSAWFEIRDGLSAITHVLSTLPAAQDSMLEDVVIHLTPYVPRAQRDWSLAAWVQLIAALDALMRTRPRVRCTLCLDFSSNFGARPKPANAQPIAEYVEKLVEALPPCRVEAGHPPSRARIGLIWQTHFKDWECSGSRETYPAHNYVGEAMGAPEWYYRLRYCAP